MVLSVAKIVHDSDVEYSFSEEAFDEVSSFVDKFVELSDVNEKDDCYIG
jgi:hypothetical protein